MATGYFISYYIDKGYFICDRALLLRVTLLVIELYGYKLLYLW